MKTSQKRKEGDMTLKLDISKAYNRIEWSYFKEMMIKLSFEGRWISLFMTCVTKMSYSVLINDQLGNMLRPKRGLRQGDSIFPPIYLSYVLKG